MCLIACVLFAQPPAWRPSNYLGAVGKFHLEASAEPAEFPIDQTFVYTLRLVGVGDVEKVKAPDLAQRTQFSANFVVDGPPQVRTLPNGKEFAYPLRARSVDVKTVPVLLFSVYDDSLSHPAYQTLTTPAVAVTVNPTAPAAAAERFEKSAGDGNDPLIFAGDLRLYAVGLGTVAAVGVLFSVLRATRRDRPPPKAAGIIRTSKPVTSLSSPLDLLAKRFGLRPGQCTSAEILAAAKAAAIQEAPLAELQACLADLDRVKFARDVEAAAELQEKRIAEWLKAANNPGR